MFAFLDYRAYLRAFYEEAKQRCAFSYRAFARRAKLRSPNYLKLVIDGERNLSPAMSQRFAEACGLSGEAVEYFQELVGFAHAHSSMVVMNSTGSCRSRTSSPTSSSR